MGHLLQQQQGYTVCQRHLCTIDLGKVIHGVKSGPKQYLSAEEETELAEFAIEMASIGCPQTRKQLMTIAENDNDILRKDKITQGWYEKFIRRQTYSVCMRDPATNDRMVTSN